MRATDSNYSWLRDPGTGGPQQVQHLVALADGGADSVGNITPMTRADHIKHHQDNGDFARWAQRGGKKCNDSDTDWPTPETLDDRD